MKRMSWEVRLGLLFIVASVVLYFCHYLVFHDAHHIFIYLLGDVAFVPIEVLLVTLIIHRLLAEREKRAIFEKLNMVIGTFFSQVGSALLRYLIEFDENFEKVRRNLVVKEDWQVKDFLATKRSLHDYDYKIDSRKAGLDGLKRFFEDERAFLIRLLENPVLLEHRTFTDLLWAVFHLADELSHREDVRSLPEADYQHLSGDMERAYVLLIREWLGYMSHLQQAYPYLFSLARRTNPFDPGAAVELA